MSQIIKKLNLKDGKEIAVINSPSSFEPELVILKEQTVVRDLNILSIF